MSFFFFKQKTAYEMRISDWSSDVCSSDLPILEIHMGETAENVAERYGISRADQDALAVEGHRRAAQAIAEGRFKKQIVPIESNVRGATVTFDTDEHVRENASLEDMAKLRPAFRKEGSVTAGNASGLNDGAAALVLASDAAVKKQGLAPMAKILGWGHAGVDPEVMGIRSEEHTSELQSLMRISYAVFGLK